MDIRSGLDQNVGPQLRRIGLGTVLRILRGVVHDLADLGIDRLQRGFIGLFLFLSLLISTFLSLASVERRIRGRPALAWAKDYAIMLRLSVVSYAVGGAFLGLAYFDLYYNVIAAVILLKILVQRELAQEEATLRAARIPTAAGPRALPLPTSP
jgi:hypothetical protein